MAKNPTMGKDIKQRVIPILTNFQDWFRLLSDPDPPELDRMIRVGEIVTWPKVRMRELL